MKLFLVVVFVFYHCESKELPSFIKKCSMANKKVMGDCLQDRVHELVPQYQSGIPELKIPSIDPLIIKEIKINTGHGGSVVLDATITNLKVEGLKNLTIKDIDFDFEKKSGHLEILMPILKIVGQNKLKGKVLLFELQSEGLLRGNIYDVDATTSFGLDTYTKNGKKYIRVNDDAFIAENTFRDANLYFEDLIPNKEINDQINLAINANIQELSKEVSPLLHEAIHTVIVTILAPIFNDYSIDELFDT
ncbi:hypothetical protein FQA39_LY18176 [Lamprigera yunnana]|nr:hypothetical protein FQA39_LY18176 [Lamprigera yunnana]